MKLALALLAALALSIVPAISRDIVLECDPNPEEDFSPGGAAAFFYRVEAEIDGAWVTVLDDVPHAPVPSRVKLGSDGVPVPSIVFGLVSFPDATTSIRMFARHEFAESLPSDVFVVDENSEGTVPDVPPVPGAPTAPRVYKMPAE